MRDVLIFPHPGWLFQCSQGKSNHFCVLPHPLIANARKYREHAHLINSSRGITCFDINEKQSFLKGFHVNTFLK